MMNSAEAIRTMVSLHFFMLLSYFGVFRPKFIVDILRSVRRDCSKLRIKTDRVFLEEIKKKKKKKNKRIDG